MKKYSLLFLFSSILLISMIGCGSEEPEPAPVEQEGSGKSNYGLNKKDSLFIVEMINMMKGRNALPDDMNWDPEDAKTWNYTYWGWDKVNEEYRLTDVTIGPKKGAMLTISPKILDCAYLRRLTLRDGVSEMPDFISKLYLTSLCIFDTSISELPDDIFSEYLTFVRIEGNSLLTKLPSSITELTDHPDIVDYFNISDNSFTGEIPPITKTKINFWYNKFTSIKISEECLKWEIKASAYAVHNNITGIVPDDILADTVKLHRLYGQVKWQNEGYGFINMPSDEEMEERRLKWNENHPDMKI